MYYFVSNDLLQRMQSNFSSCTLGVFDTNLTHLAGNELNADVEGHKSKVGEPKAPFSVASKPRFRGGFYSFPWIAPLNS